MYFILAAILAANPYTDPLQNHAYRALHGEWGPIKEQWKRDAYDIVLERNIKCCGRAYLTSYGPWDPPKMYGGKWASDDSRGPCLLDDTMCAANPEVKFGTLVWAAGEFRIVRDHGGMVKIKYAKQHDKRNTFNFDYHCHDRDRFHSESTPCAVLPGDWRD